jgi:hypothetical protein
VLDAAAHKQRNVTFELRVPAALESDPAAARTFDGGYGVGMSASYNNPPKVLFLGKCAEPLNRVERPGRPGVIHGPAPRQVVDVVVGLHLSGLAGGPAERVVDVALVGEAVRRVARVTILSAPARSGAE